MTIVSIADLQTELFEIGWPIGSIFITSKPGNPTTLIKGATNSVWKQITSRFLIGADDTYPLTSTGGEATHTLIEQELPEISGSIKCPVPPYHHNYVYGHMHGTSWEDGTGEFTSIPTPENANTTWGYEYSFGGNGAHNNIPPYYAVNI